MPSVSPPLPPAVRFEVPIHTLHDSRNVKQPTHANSSSITGLQPSTLAAQAPTAKVSVGNAGWSCWKTGSGVAAERPPTASSAARNAVSALQRNEVGHENYIWHQMH